MGLVKVVFIERLSSHRPAGPNPYTQHHTNGSGTYNDSTTTGDTIEAMGQWLSFYSRCESFKRGSIGPITVGNWHSDS